MLSVMDPADRTRWLTNGTANYYTGDGVHPNDPGVILMAGELRTAIVTLWPAVAA
jgi:lysophospholipase L1-like esterase